MKGEYANEISKTSVKQIIYFYLYLSAFTFGGGYVIVTLMKKKFVDQYHWIDDEEMLDLIAIAQSSPGAIAVNGAIVVGYKLAGIPGVLLCVLATVLPPFVIIPSFLYFTLLSRAMSGYGFFWKGCNPVLRLSSHQLFMIWPRNHP